LCGRRETPAGGRDRGDPAGALAPRRLPEPPAESEAPGAQINSPIYTALKSNDFRLLTVLFFRKIIFIVWKKNIFTVII
jgi:hypothetical protein